MYNSVRDIKEIALHHIKTNVTMFTIAKVTMLSNYLMLVCKISMHSVLFIFNEENAIFVPVFFLNCICYA